MNSAGIPPEMAAWVSRLARQRFATNVRGAVAPSDDVEHLRGHYDALNRQRLSIALARYRVSIERTTIGEVPVAIVEPEAGITVGGALICLHGGAFMWGAGAGALVEAIPVAATSGRVVIAVDYRLAPEHKYPAAIDDVVAVYSALLRDYGAQSIGLYGCSAGGTLASQTIARLLRDDVPGPGAIAMLHGTGIEIGGDSVALAGILNGVPDDGILPALAALPFLAGVDPCDPLVFQGDHPSVLAGFPPCLLISGTRDFAASAIATMHRRLQSAGVCAGLTLFDGMWHAHHVDTDLPESQETFNLMAHFFAIHLKTDQPPVDWRTISSTGNNVAGPSVRSPNLVSSASASARPATSQS